MAFQHQSQFIQSNLQYIHSHQSNSTVRAAVADDLFRFLVSCDHSTCLSNLKRAIQELISCEVTYNQGEQKFESEQDQMAVYIFDLLFKICPSGAIAIADVAAA